jgi:hypothetical protein
MLQVNKDFIEIVRPGFLKFIRVVIKFTAPNKLLIPAICKL